MIPSVVAAEVFHALRDFLVTGFTPSNPDLANVIDGFLAEPGNLTRGPYLSLSLPFRKAPGDEPFPQVPLGFAPYYHQRVAMERLASGSGKSTVVATGTGSGKTECYLLPILDHCRNRAGQSGIKAIIIYPMNALAVDQATRIGRAIHRNPALRRKITAGLYVGGREETPRKKMTAEHIITDRETLRQSPPDILLTNYKMLDYLMIRPGDQRLWRHNLPGTLRYLVVDELHTFDGAQGTDLACLIRRLRARLQVPSDALVCVGTSATIGTGDDTSVCVYATRVFNQEFEPGSVVGETRQATEEFLSGTLITGYLLPTDRLVETLDPRRHATSTSYLRAAHEAFFNEPPAVDLNPDDWKVTLSDRLREHTTFRNLLQVLGGEPKPLPEVASRLRRTLPVGSEEEAAAVLNALCALISSARLRDDNGDLRPFLDVGVHLWVRELARMVCSVSEGGASESVAVDPVRRLRHSDDLQAPSADDRSAARAVHLPLIQCRECRVTGWAAVKRANEPCVEPDLRMFYNMFFRRDVDVRFLFPGDKPTIRSAQHMICGRCGWLGMGEQLSGSGKSPACAECGSNRVVRVHVPDSVRTGLLGGKTIHELSRDCPYCHASEGLIIFGARAASLTSVLCSQTFASRHNDDPKALAFSDNVQNAAHRAGFIAARSRQTHTRTAIAHVVAAHDRVSLERLPGAVVQYWREQAGRPEDFVGEHIADDRRWMGDVLHLEREGSLPAGSNLPKLVAERLEWETLREFTFGSGIGRTLERTGVAAVAMDRARVEKACRKAHTRIREEVGVLLGMGEQAVRAMVLGVLRRMKDRGAVRHSLMDKYLRKGGNQWATWDRDLALPKFGKRSLIPVFPVCSDPSSFPPPPHTRVYDGVEEVHGPRGRRSWYRRWCESLLAGESALGPAESDHVLRLVFGALKDAEMVSNVRSGSRWVWALEPGSLSVTTDATFFPLDGPGRPLTIAAADADLWAGVPCLDGSVTSSRYCNPDHSGSPAVDSPTWFGRLYRHGQVRRIVAAEHTALVERVDRERLQRIFAKPNRARQPWEPNLVSATPTLELGIDIGDLSTVTLCSVPPATANYRQRAGRAGRLDGNALILTLANAAPHDLYFYAEPLEMLAGGVDPPGIFLDAVAVLERQMTAYCLDNWVASGTPEDAVPKKIGMVLTNVEKDRHEGFPYPFFSFVRNEEEHLIEGFLNAFSGDLAQSSRAELRSFVLGDVDKQKPSLILKILNCLKEVIKERNSIAADIRSLGKRIRKLKSRPKDEATTNEINELENVRKGLRAVHGKINARDTFNFLTDEGLVPNYAFPEAGVKLRSVILERKRAQGGEGGEDTRAITHDYERPAAMALGEFAPENRFYARAHQVEISRVDTRVSELERWRMCPSCVYAENVDAGDHHSACPRCGNLQWQDSGQLRDLLRLRLVHAVADGRTSRIDDQKDDREHLFYTRNLVADFDPVDVERAYAINKDEVAFGFEYIASATFREVNFGRMGQPTQSVRVAGMKLPREGFRVCRRCGTVNSGKGSKPAHMPTCPSRHSGQDAIVDCLYLYRDFQSEAIRMLLPPAVGPDAERCERSFLAALELGLRQRFGGEIAHLRAMTCAYPVEGSDQPQKYVLLYDTVPGGTGYLKDRMTAPERLLSVFEAALAAIEECSCNQYPEKDGCHRCVLGYRRSRDMQDTSRETARHLLRNILDARDRLEKVEGLSKVRVVVTTDSVLEDRFIEALRRVAATSGQKASLQYDLVDGKPGYVLRIGSGGADGHAWYVVPQVDVGLSDGVVHPSRPDFLIRPAKASAIHPPVAVFMDGFEYHRDRVDDDSVKRMALVRAGFVVWSATWDDVKVVLGEAQAPNVLIPSRDPQPPMDQVQRGLDAQWQTSELRSALAEPTLKLLGRYLADPDPALWRRAVFTQLVGEFDQATMTSADFAKRFAEAAKAALPEGAVDFLDQGSSAAPTHDAHVFAGRGAWRSAGGEGPAVPFANGLINLLLAMPPSALQRFDSDAMWATIHLFDDDSIRTREDFQNAWNGALRLCNLLQFLPLAWWTTRRGREANLYHELPLKSRGWMAGVLDEHDGPETENAWAEALRYVVDDLKPDLLWLRERDFPPPEVGFELTGPRGVLAEAELGWEARRVAVLMTDENADRVAFESHGWSVIIAPSDDLAGSIAALLTGDPT
ncbi:MAG: DEAD/DEAH box helicase [Acidobacteriota bacterium]|nr:DEAD/DEAH box helicase [Acidobacteriota bacterium]